MLQYYSEDELIAKIRRSAKLYSDIINVNVRSEALKKVLIQIKMNNGDDTYAYILNIYEDFIDELYVSAIQNPLYRNVLKNVGDKYILHALGETNKNETVFTRYEFEYELNALKAYVQANYK